MRKIIIILAALLGLGMPAFAGGSTAPVVPGTYAPAVQTSTVQAQQYETTPDLSTDTLTPSTPPAFAPFSATDRVGPNDIVVDPSQLYQQFYGVGGAWSDASCYVLQNDMSATQRAALLSLLYSPSQDNWTIGRIAFGSPDFRSQTTGYTYDDMPSGQVDTSLINESVAPDTKYIIPTLQQVETYQPNMHWIAGVWQPPYWMISSGTFETSGEVLNSADYATYGTYLTNAILDYQSYGIPIWAISVANEPGSQTWLNLSAAGEESIIGDLGPDLINAGLQTHICCNDDNFSGTSYTTSILASATSSPYTWGVLWHGYSGSPSKIGTVWQAYPNIVEIADEWRSITTEPAGTDLAGHAAYIFQSIHNGASAVIGWNVPLDQNGGPQYGLDTGLSPQRRGIVTVNNSTGAVTYNAEYYAYCHVSKFVEAGARVCYCSVGGGAPYTAYTTYPTTIQAVAFLNPDGSIVLCAWNGLNTTTTSTSFTAGASTQIHVIDARSHDAFQPTLTSGAMYTWVWGTSNQNSPMVASSSTAVPSTPSLTATPGSGQVNLSWSAPTSTGPLVWYNVLRSSTSGAETQIAQVPAATTSYADLLGTSGTYYYKLQAVSAPGGVSASSSEQSATATAAAVPSAPASPSAVVSGSNILVAWTASTPNGSTVTAYNVSRGTSSGGESALVTANQGSTSYTDTTPVAGTNYFYKIAAVNTTGTGSNSSEVSAEVPGSITQDAVSTGYTGAGTNPLTWTHTQGTLVHGYVLVSCGYSQENTGGGGADGSGITSVTYAGSSLTFLGYADANVSSSTDRSIALFGGTTSAASGSETVSVDATGSTSALICTAVTYSGVNQSTPTRTLVTAIGASSGQGTTLSMTTTGGAASDVVVSTIHIRFTGGTDTATGSGQSVIESNTQTNNVILFSSQPGGTGSIVSSWGTWTSDNSAGVTVAIRQG